MKQPKTLVTPVFSCENVGISFSQENKNGKLSTLIVVKDLNIRIHAKEIVAIVGSSGSGKSLLAHSILGILPHNAQTTGIMSFNGKKLDTKQKEKLRGKNIALIPQNISYLDPAMKIGQQIAQGKLKANRQKVCSILNRYGLENKISEKYPFELSGGMIRRVLIAAAVYQNPDLIIADEPTPGLHPTVAKQVLSHFKQLSHEGKAILLITHDLETALHIADRVVVFYAGVTLEEAKASDFADKKMLRHPYTQALFQATPSQGFIPLEGFQPVKHTTNGCVFANRCTKYTIHCEKQLSYQPLNGGFVRCIHPQGDN
ncbi:MAG: ATP-binding cassette domain-containing protein [Treponemataceae bacterium]